MAVVTIPVTNDPESWVAVKLDGVNYTLRLRWNVRSGAWFMDILDAEDNFLAAGRKLVVEWALNLLRDTDPNLPQGMLFCRDTTGQKADPTLESLGTTVLLLYSEAD